ncbi:MAG: S1C family serine protease [Actinomycetota bacterium]|nr:S1C family serine protease [Actinomycetota bacterium]
MEPQAPQPIPDPQSAPPSPAAPYSPDAPSSDSHDAPAAGGYAPPPNPYAPPPNPYAPAAGGYAPPPNPYGPSDPYPPSANPYLEQHAAAPAPPPPASPKRSRRRRTVAMSVATVTALAAVAGVAFAAGRSDTVSGSGSAASVPSIDSQGLNPGSGPGSGGSSSGSSGSAGSAGSGTTSTTTATAKQSIGVVDINTVLGYQQAKAAGTGILLSSTGEILTNNHVIDGATQISVTVVSTGATYSASVVGTDPSADVAVIQLVHASGLQTANTGNSSTVQVGAAVTGVGNAGGVGGSPSAATGQVLAINQQLTASDTSGQNAEQLSGMIETNAPIAAGDSGGPLYNAANQIIGIDTAAATNGRSTTAGYAIPINTALNLAAQIESGPETTAIHLGYPGFLGVSVSATASGEALIAGVVASGPAAKAGIVAGDVITSVNGSAVGSATDLKSALSTVEPGQQVSVGWTDSAGATHVATVTLIAGPAD